MESSLTIGLIELKQLFHDGFTRWILRAASRGVYHATEFNYRLPTACQGAKSQQLAGTTEGVTILV